MNPTFETQSSPATAEYAFNVVIVREDSASGDRARALFQRITQRLGPAWESGFTEWTFDMLRLGNLRRSAARDAAEASMIVVARRGDAGLPGHVELWLDLWQSAQDQDCAVVELVGGESGNQSPSGGAVRSHLERRKCRGEVEFFIQKLPEPRACTLTDPDLDEAETAALFLSRLAAHEPLLRHHGINE